ncbi:MAG: hypothetical protein HGA25_07045 [Clostridiales bacterium]|nr:hypothetical protein [Clostridiales bacterium]
MAIFSLFNIFILLVTAVIFLVLFIITIQFLLEGTRYFKKMNEKLDAEKSLHGKNDTIL